jgi:hypothetical protein
MGGKEWRQQQQEQGGVGWIGLWRLKNPSLLLPPLLPVDNQTVGLLQTAAAVTHLRASLPALPAAAPH